MGKKNSAQIADKQIKQIKLLLKVLFTKFLMDLFPGIQNSGRPLSPY